MTPLLAASQVGHDAIVRLLLDAGAKADQANDRGVTPLSVAARMGHAEICRMLTEPESEREAKNGRATQGPTNSYLCKLEFLLWASQ